MCMRVCALIYITIVTFIQYSRLVQLCKDIIASTCSSSNITTLLSSTDYAINKVAIWRGSVISAINKLSSDYPMYPDVMLPLVASLMGLVNGVSTSVWIGQQLSLTSEQVSKQWFI